MSLWNLCIRRPVFASMMIAFLLVLGLFSYRQLGLDLFPKVDFPIVTITTTLRGASPEEMETEVTKPIEEVVNTIEGIDELTSTTTEGVSQVVVRFVLERELEAAAQDVRDKVSTILKDLPEGTDPPVVDKFDIESAPVMSIAVAGSRGLREVTEIAKKQVKEDIETLLGVGSVIMVGGRDRAVNVYVDAGKLDAYGLSIQQVKAALQAQNLEMPGGRVDQGQKELVLRTMGRIERAEEFNDLIVSQLNARPILLKDLGYAEDSVEEPRSLSRLDGQAAVTLLVRKQSGTNTVEVIDRVKGRLAQLKKEVLPEDIRLEAIADQSRFIKRSITEIQHHLILGGLLATLIVYLFMGNLRSTLIAGIAIPTSIIATFTLMRAMGFTLNNITLLALTLAVGIVIDDAIVVMENIFRHIEEEGEEPMEAASRGTAEIGLAVMATTLSLVVIFLPVAFMYGQVGRFFNSFGITMAFSILVSLFISFTLTPLLCSRMYKKGSAGEGKGRRKSQKESFFYRAIDRAYAGMLRGSLRHRWVVMLLAIAVVALIPRFFKIVGKDFIPSDDRSEFEVSIQTPEGSTLERTDQIFREVEGKLRGLRGVTNLLTTIGGSKQAGVTNGIIYVRLVDLEKRSYSQMDVMKEARRFLGQYPDLRTSVQDVQTFTSGGFRRQTFNFNLRGPDLLKLQGYADHITERLRQVPGMVDVDTSLVMRKPELRVNIDRKKASDLGIQVADIASALNILVGGEKVTQYKEGADQYDVWLRAVREDRRDDRSIYQLSVPSDRHELVKLENLVRLEEEKGPSQIERQDRQRQIAILANLDNLPLGAAMEKAQAIVGEMQMPVTYQTRFSGRAKALAEAASNFLLAFLLSIIFMYMILAAQFEHLLHPVTIMLSLPLSLPFALFTLIGFGETLNVYSILGLFVLFGIVKKNGILQVDYTNTLRKRGMERDPAILEANRVRLRPILMTTITLVAGMVPMALGQGPGAATRASMAKLIIGGQSLCLLLTLLVTPVAYSLFDDVGQWIRGVTGSRRGPRRAWAARVRRRLPFRASPEGAPLDGAGTHEGQRCEDSLNPQPPKEVRSEP